MPHALATLAYDGRRSAYFRKELLCFADFARGHITPSNMKGSWAGAMGQSQFMPSSFLSYAVDWNGDGKRDIWGTKPDVFASTAYYLKAGWNDQLTWGRRVLLPDNFIMDGKDAMTLADKKIQKNLQVWAAAGVRSADGAPLPKANPVARLVMPSGAGGNFPCL